MKATDNQIIDVYKRTRNYTKAATELGLSKQGLRTRVLQLKSQGVELPNSIGKRKHFPKIGGSAQG